MADLWNVPNSLGGCACSQLRRATRRVSSFYDGFLHTSGLTVTQHSLLVNIARAGAVSRSALAALLGMDRTTLTRNLQPLERDRLVVPAPAGADRRERLLRLSSAGRRKLAESYPLWEQAQQKFVEEMGSSALDQLRRLLKAAETAAEAASERA